MKRIFFIAIMATFAFTACNDKKVDGTKKNIEPTMANNNSEKTDEIQLSEQQIQLGNIQVDTIRNGVVGDQMTLTATLNVDESKINVVSARVGGRIDKLHYKNVGDHIIKGAKLYDLYSEQLNNAKQEYILALEKQSVLDNSIIDFSQLVKAAKNKLLLWGMNDAQIAILASTKKYSTLTTFYSTASGTITTLDIKEGDYVTEGGTIVHLADLSTLWAEAQVYASQLSSIDRREEAIVQIPDMPNKEIKGQIDFENPEISPDTRINLVRVTIPNYKSELRPGMPAYVILKSRRQHSLLLPVNAVIRDSKGASVWIKTGKNNFKNRMVETGTEGDHLIEIKSGLKRGDIIVISGAYLINSEYIFKRGADPMAGMKM